MYLLVLSTTFLAVSDCELLLSFPRGSVHLRLLRYAFTSSYIAFDASTPFHLFFFPVHFMLHYCIYLFSLFHTWLFFDISEPLSIQLLSYPVSFHHIFRYFTIFYYMQLSDIGFL